MFEEQGKDFIVVVRQGDKATAQIEGEEKEFTVHNGEGTIIVNGEPIATEDSVLRSSEVDTPDLEVDTEDTHVYANGKQIVKKGDSAKNDAGINAIILTDNETVLIGATLQLGGYHYEFILEYQHREDGEEIYVDGEYRGMVFQDYSIDIVPVYSGKLSNGEPLNQTFFFGNVPYKNPSDWDDYSREKIIKDGNEDRIVRIDGSVYEDPENWSKFEFENFNNGTAKIILHTIVGVYTDWSYVPDMTEDANFEIYKDGELIQQYTIEKEYINKWVEKLGDWWYELIPLEDRAKFHVCNIDLASGNIETILQPYTEDLYTGTIYGRGGRREYYPYDY